MKRTSRPEFMRGLTKPQIAAFEQIAMGNSTGRECSRSAIDKLAEKGLIVQIGEEVICKDRFGTVAIPVYEVPISFHMAWCWWCDKVYEPKDEL